MSSEILIQDPYSDYAISFMELYYSKYRMKSVVFYTDPAQRREQSWKFPALASEIVCASYEVDLNDLEALARVLIANHNIAAVVPFCEAAVEPADDLSSALGLSWAQHGVLARFRDKHNFKRFVGAHPVGPDMVATTIVKSIADIRQEVTVRSYDRFVLKPNDGSGNRNIGFFDANTTDEQLAAYLAETVDSDVLMAKFVAGEEYFVTGQIDADGNVTVVAIFQCMIIEVNGRPNVPAAYRIVATTEPVFAELLEYGTAVIRASELRRSPFHVDMLMGRDGPYLLEAGARLAGMSTAYLVNLIHGGKCDVVDVAAHYYLTADDYGPLALNWDRYNAKAYAIILGISHKRALIYQINGIDEVEDLPGFIRWVRQPELGQLVAPTVDVFTVPWVVMMSAPSTDALRMAADGVRETLGWNGTQRGLDAVVPITSAIWIDVKKKSRELPFRSPIKPKKVGATE